jgi:putative phage-type endonuclease
MSKEVGNSPNTAPTKRGGRVLAKYESRAEWLALRSRGIGGSEIGTVLGVNPWKSANQLFFEKLGLFQEEGAGNMRMFMGNFMESHIAELWRFWDGDEASLMANYAERKPIRKCSYSNSTIWLAETPYLIANIDRRIDSVPGKIGRGVLECKTINGFYSQQWAAGVPPSYLYQIQQYMLVTGYQYAELALLKDGNSLQVIQFDADPNAQQVIREGAEVFWQRIENARKFALQYLQEEEKPNPDRSALADYMRLVEQYEPKADGSPAYEEFMRKRFAANGGEMKIATAQDIRLAKRYAEINAQKKVLEESRQEVANELMRRIGDGDGIDMGDLGKVTWKANDKGVRVLRVATKI